jgi:filamentous hemagglutinin family protein
MSGESHVGVCAGGSGCSRAWQLRICVFGTLLLGHAVHPSIGWGQTAITSSGLNTMVPPNCTTCDITGGTPRGSNLFHSFGQFSVGEGGTANFLNNAGLTGVTNILGRVTGGDLSSVNGTIQTTNFGTANLFLINPAGWMFGSGASINVGGSFHVSTANYIRLSDGVQFSAVPTLGEEALLTSASPAAFGFSGPTVAPISVSLEGGLLTVPEGKTLSFVGGDVSITGSTPLRAKRTNSDCGRRALRRFDLRSHDTES